MKEQYETLLQELKDQDNKARSDNTLVGRYLEVEIQDSTVYYVIVEELKNKVKVQLVSEISDCIYKDWGTEKVLGKKLITEKLNFNDSVLDILGI